MTPGTTGPPGEATAAVPASPSTPGRPPAPGLGLALGLVVAAQFVLQLDSSIVNIALPAIKRELHFAPGGPAVDRHRVRAHLRLAPAPGRAGR